MIIPQGMHEPFQEPDQGPSQYEFMILFEEDSSKCFSFLYEHQGGEKRGGSGGGMNWEIGTDIYTLICIK